MTRLIMYQGREVSPLEYIKIYSLDEASSVTLPRCRPTLSYQDETISATMASGKMVEDIVGMRPVIKASYGYIPAVDMAKLHTFVLEGGFHKVEAPGIDGSITGLFKISPPSFEVFRYIAGEPMWCNVSLTLTAQEVISA